MTNMRPNEPIPPSFVRPKLNQRDHSETQPLWMRVLEEKYQKLQLRIAQSTATMNSLYNSTIGKSIYDTKLVRASIQAPQHNVIHRRNGKYESKTRISATKISTNNIVQRVSDENCNVSRSVEFCSDVSRGSDMNTCIQKDINDRSSQDAENVNTADKPTEINNQRVRVSEILCLRYDKNRTRRKNLSELIKTQSNKLSKSFVGDYGNTKHSDLTSSRHSVTTQKTTTKSCPVENENSSHSNMNCSRVDSAGKSKINRRKMKMFSRMSAEAQAALTETILENDSVRNLDSDDEEECNDKEKKEGSVFGNDCIVSIDDINNMNGKQDCNDSEVSMASRDSRSIHTRLPEIQNESQEYMTLRNIPHKDGRVPGVGTFSFSTKRETTFEITPPGFDIRYKDAPIREERESETPPPDIRDRAIRKCQDWLTRYTPRTPRQSQSQVSS